MTSRAACSLLTLCLAAAGWGPSRLGAQATDRARPWDAGWEPPTTAWGHPDLQGSWTNATLTPFERERGLGPAYTWAEAERIETEYQARFEEGLAPSDPDRPAPDVANDPGTYNRVWIDRGDQIAVVNGEPRTSMITFPADGRVPPFSPEGSARQRRFEELLARFGAYDHPELRPIAERCVTYFGSSPTGTLGPPMTPTRGYNNNYTIVQNAGHVMISGEMIHDTRVIRLADSRPLPEAVRPWFGDSRGHWEGSTLVVETTNIRVVETTHINPADRVTVHSEDMMVVERFTRVDHDTILYEFEVHDPRTYSEPWGGQIPMERFDEMIYEYACHEGNYALANVLSGARYQESVGR